jgi:hypothetical protein
MSGAALAHNITGYTLTGVEVLDINNTGSVTVTNTQATGLTTIDFGTTSTDSLVISGTQASMTLGGKLTNFAGTANAQDIISATGVTNMSMKGSEASTTGQAKLTGSSTMVLTLTDAYAGEFDNAAANGAWELDTIKELSFGNFKTSIEAGVIGELTTITGSGGASTELELTEDAAFDLSAETITGITLLDVKETAAKDVTLTEAFLEGITTIDDADSDDTNDMIVVASASGSTIAATGLTHSGGFDEITIDSGDTAAAVTLNVNQSMIMATMSGTNGGGGANDIINISASAATSAFNMSLTATAAAVALNVLDGTGANTITASETVAVRNIMTASLANGGNDTIVIEDLVHAAGALEINITGFGAGLGAAADVLDIKLGDTAGDMDKTSNTDFITVTGAAQAMTLAATSSNYDIVEVNQAIATVTDLTATAAAGAVEAAFATAIGTVTTGNSEHIGILYGTGAAANKAGIYSVLTTAANADLTAANTTVELLAVLDGVAADSLVESNFA